MADYGIGMGLGEASKMWPVMGMKMLELQNQNDYRIQQLDLSRNRLVEDKKKTDSLEKIRLAREAEVKVRKQKWEREVADMTEKEKKVDARSDLAKRGIREKHNQDDILEVAKRDGLLEMDETGVPMWKGKHAETTLKKVNEDPAIGYRMMSKDKQVFRQRINDLEMKMGTPEGMELIRKLPEEQQKQVIKEAEKLRADPEMFKQYSDARDALTEMFNHSVNAAEDFKQKFDAKNKVATGLSLEDRKELEKFKVGLKPDKEGSAGTWTYVGTDEKTGRPILLNNKSSVTKLGNMPIAPKEKTLTEREKMYKKAREQGELVATEKKLAAEALRLGTPLEDVKALFKERTGKEYVK